MTTSDTAAPMGARNATLADMAASLREQQARKVDIVAPASAVRAAGGRLVIGASEPVLGPDGVTMTSGTYTPTDVCDQGVADKLGIPAAYLRRLREQRPGLYDANVNGWLEGDERRFLVRCLRPDTGEGPGIARAFLSDGYKIIDSLDVLLAALDGVRNSGFPVRIDGCDLTERRMYVRVVCEQVRVMAPALLAGYRSPFTGASGAENPVVFAGFVLTNCLLTEQADLFLQVRGHAGEEVVRDSGRPGWLRCVLMSEYGEAPRDLLGLAVPLVGALRATGEQCEPYQVIDAGGRPVGAAAEFFRDLQAAGRSAATVRSYGMDLLRWFRFLWALGMAWDRVTRLEARDFCRWMQVAGKPPQRPGRDRGPVVLGPVGAGLLPGMYAASVRAHAETVLRGFYDMHLRAGTGPLINPFPLARARRGGRAHAHHNPMEPYRNERAGLYRPRVPARVPRSVPDEEFNRIFAQLSSHRDRALVAFYVSTGARASELLSVTQGGADPGRQLITVTRKGTREQQELPASADAFVWLRLYQAQAQGLVPVGARLPLWWTLRQPVRPLTYHGVHRMFERAVGRAGSTVTLHALRHTAAYRMAEDPQLPLTDVQFVLGHAQLATTQLYTTPRKEDVICRLLAHHAGQASQAAAAQAVRPAAGYRPDTLEVLFGTGRP
jgi:integrase